MPAILLPLLMLMLLCSVLAAPLGLLHSCGLSSNSRASVSRARHVTLLQGHPRLISASWLSDMKNSYYSWTYKWEAYSSDTIQTLNILRDTVENRHLKKTILTLRSHVALIHFSVCDEEFVKFEMSLVEYGIASGHVETAWRKRFTSIQRVHSISTFFLQ